MNHPNSNPDHDEIEYVGAPTEFADVQEVPLWVANVAKAVWFLPAAFVTATTIPLVLGSIVLFCCLLMGVLMFLL